MPILSSYARRGKLQYFFRDVPKEARILELGCGDGWLGAALRAGGWRHYTGLDLHPPADIVGDIRRWRDLGLTPASYDVVVAFELVEHVDCFQEVFDLLKPGGLMFLSSPHPRWDWACRLLEFLGISQRRSSPHTHLINFHDIPLFAPASIRRVGLLAQWGIFRKPDAGNIA